MIKDTSSKKPFSSPIPSHKRFPDDVKYGKEKVGSNVMETLRSKTGQKKDEAFLKPKMHRKKHKSKTKETIKLTSQVDPKASELLQKESEKFMSFFEPQTTRFTDDFWFVTKQVPVLVPVLLKNQKKFYLYRDQDSNGMQKGELRYFPTFPEMKKERKRLS